MNTHVSAFILTCCPISSFIHCCLLYSLLMHVPSEADVFKYVFSVFIFLLCTIMLFFESHLIDWLISHALMHVHAPRNTHSHCTLDESSLMFRRWQNPDSVQYGSLPTHVEEINTPSSLRTSFVRVHLLFWEIADIKRSQSQHTALCAALKLSKLK